MNLSSRRLRGVRRTDTRHDEALKLLWSPDVCDPALVSDRQVQEMAEVLGLVDEDGAAR